MKIIEIRLYILNQTVCCTQPQKFPQSCCAAALGRTCRRRLSSWHRARHRAAGGSYDPWGPAGDSSFFEGCLGRIRHPEQRVVSNMFCYVVFLTRFCPCPAPKLKSDMIPWGVRPSAFVFTSLQEGYRQSWITHWSRQSTRPRRKWGRRSRKVMEVGKWMTYPGRIQKSTEKAPRHWIQLVQLGIRCINYELNHHWAIYYSR